jgi:two-component sensor histidine kinase
MSVDAAEFAPSFQHQQADELSTMTRLHGLADRLLAISDLPTGLGEVLDTAMDVFGSDRGTVQILDPEKGVLRYGASRGFDETMLAAIPPIDRDFHSTCAACIRTGERVVAGDIATDPRWRDHASTAAALGYGAAFSAPMKTRRDELLGVLTVHFDRPYTPSERELRWTDLFARMAAHLIERARAEVALRGSESRLAAELAAAQQLQAFSTVLISEQQPDALYEQLLDAAMALMKADAASVQILDSDGARLRLLASRNFHPESVRYWQWVDAGSKTSFGMALDTNTRVLIQDIETWAELAQTQDLAEYRRCGLRSVQSTPLIGRDGKRLGMLSTHWRKAYPSESGVFLNFFDALARQAADLIERTRAEAAQKELAERQQVLVRELQHRTRNLLGVVRSITNRTLEESASLDDFGTTFRERVSALARVNGLLSRLAEGARITFDELLRTELEGHGFPDGKAGNGQVRLSGPNNVRLRSSTVQTLALGLHELITNAVKYGALSKPEGQLSIRWSVQNGAGEQRLEVDWQEDGVPPELVGEGETQRKGYGRELIEKALPYQLNAKTSYTLGPQGVRCSISIPVSSSNGGGDGSHD